MPWRKVKPPKYQYGETATLRENGIFLSGAFISNQRLEGYEYVEIFIDDNLRRIGFKFHKTPTADTSKLAKESKHGRIIQTRSWRRDASWVENILRRPASDRRFIIKTDESIESPTTGVRYYIFVGYHFNPRRVFAKQEDYPRLPGVYRLFKENEIVRIGESDNLEARLKEHFRDYRDEVDKYDFCEIEDSYMRKEEEKRLLREFKDMYGRLPRLNCITA
ncbi:GIY-YIG nuclease family protein [Candidatus Poribacteria bacterium]|nr:GIY-YIG nuclease family protein [Candidatus Poribacteria bacterium]